MSYQGEKHGRTHCPGGHDPIPCLDNTVPWARRRLRSNQTIQSGVLTSIDFDDDTNDYTDDFTLVTVSGQGKGIRVESDGVYVMLFRVIKSVVGVWTDHVLDINNFGPTTDVEYELFSYPMAGSIIGMNERNASACTLVTRIKENSRVVPFILHQAGSDRTITDGTFFEMFRLSPNVTVTGLDWP